MAEYMLNLLLGYVSDRLTCRIYDLAFAHGYDMKCAQFNIHIFWNLAVSELQWHKIHGEWKMELFHQMHHEITPDDLQYGQEIFKKVRKGIHDVYKQQLVHLCYESLMDLQTETKRRKVHFSDTEEVHILDMSPEAREARKGPWLEILLNRQHFHQRVKRVGEILTPVLQDKVASSKSVASDTTPNSDP